jgi:hypothetical protein
VTTAETIDTLIPDAVPQNESIDEINQRLGFNGPPGVNDASRVKKKDTGASNLSTFALRISPGNQKKERKIGKSHFSEKKSKHKSPDRRLRLYAKAC